MTGGGPAQGTGPGLPQAARVLCLLFPGLNHAERLHSEFPGSLKNRMELDCMVRGIHREHPSDTPNLRRAP